ncbi:Coiled-coil domain-containing protein 142 [Papilio xuthus]|uniref:Coiled-coil domain-containing protein 142 n=1 Tax=Papilio xuthus TaxID=66420 RepID=A0A194PIL4_PAPXU|nr:Coiled-coil domain-containing protein 142 [Papilio xuthus]
MLQSIYSLIATILNTCLHREDSRKLLESCLRLVEIYNNLMGLSYKKFTSKFNSCSNTYPQAVSATKAITLTKIVQFLSKSRAEVNCHRLINCLVKLYSPGVNADIESNSSTADSLEIYHTLTKHITPPTSSASRQMSVAEKREAFIESKKSKMKQVQSMVEKINGHRKLSDVISQHSDGDIPYTSLLTNECVLDTVLKNEENVNSILQSEEIYIEILLDTVANIAPILLGPNGVKKLKTGRIQVSKKAAHKVTEYYQNILWGDVGSCLEHIILWWSKFPLGTRSPNTSQNLRQWLFTTFNVNNTPELILSALRILADALGCHVTTTSWDRHFGATFTTNLKPASLKMYPELSVYITESTISGANFALMLQELVTLNNQCEVTWDHILGAPIEDLPLVEQIPILHRLGKEGGGNLSGGHCRNPIYLTLAPAEHKVPLMPDALDGRPNSPYAHTATHHSIHTYRLWCLSETRRLANLWQMDDFFRITLKDMQVCLEQLANLRFADHTASIEAENIGVHEKVSANMREKLVSEIKVNIQKLKDASEEIVEVLSSVCTTSSLAHLTMIFPSNTEWRRISHPQPDFSVYVQDFLDTMLLPVIKATDDVTSLNLILRIMCESWLHHIYVAKVKFTKEAALQLLSDFDEVRVWLNDCIQLSAICRKQMLQNEVLRRCEGVGRLLLHAPGDLISMQDSTMQSAKNIRKHESDTPEQLMPAEMYVPNQKQWLTLRAKNFKGPIAFTLCC